MSSEKTASAVNVLKGDLAAGWNLLEGSSADYTDLGVARRFGGAAAAYSLRDIGAMNGKVVNVRREPHDDDDPGVNDETDFSASQVQSGALEDWVNGKLENALPADVATAAAAYSLRKVKASYSGDAVRIRRSSDDIEVDVAFDSDDKVSASSAITNIAEQGGESGSTTATTVAEFLSEERTTFITNPVMTTVSGDVTVLSNTTSSTEFTFTFSGSTGNGFVRHNGKPNNLGADIGDTVSFDITASGLSQQCGVRARRTGANNDAISPGINNIDNGTQTITFTVTSNGPVGYLAFVNLGSASTGTIRVHNLKVIGKSAFVHTWYNQSGDGGATQATDTKQPKIASSGTLLDHLLFDGTDDFLADTNVTFEGAVTLACLSEKAADGLYSVSAARQGATNRFFGIQEQSSASAFLPRNNTSGATVTTTASGNTRLTFARTNADTDQAVASMGKSLSTGTNDYGNTPTASLINHFVIGALTTGSGGTPDLGTWNGKIFEAIGYQTDETDNKFKIESNINNYYGLYNDANEFSGNPVAAGGASAAITLTNVSKTGFTAEISATSGTKQINFPLLNSLVSGDDYFVSFDYTSTSTSTVGVKPRTAALGSASNDVIAATNSRFYSGTGDSQHNGFDVNNTATVLSFQTTAQSFTFTVSNLRVSRIARNGFVETWYDQSGNGNNATQASANSQPKIVTNGGIMTLENGTPSLGFNRSGGLSHFTLDSGISNEPYTFFATTVHNGLHYFRIFAEGNNPPSIILNSGSGGSIVYYPSDSDSSGTLSTTAIFSDNIVSGFSGVNGGADGIVRINGTNLKTDISRTQAADSITQIGRFPNTSAPFSNIESLVIYESDLSSDFDTIEKELAQPINIL
jgi:hypothetical protein